MTSTRSHRSQLRYDRRRRTALRQADDKSVGEMCGPHLPILPFTSLSAESLSAESLPAESLPAESLHAKGLRWQRMGKTQQAMECLGRAIQLAPRRGEYYHDLSTLLQEVGRIQDALNLNAVALTLHPQFAPAVDLRGQLLHQMGETEQGLAVYRQYLERGIPSAAIVNNYGSLYHEAGCVEQAIVQYERAMAIDPHLVDPYFNLSEIARTGGYRMAGKAVARLNRLVASESLTSIDHARGCFALAVAHEGRHDYPQAFSWFRRGNESVEHRQAATYTTSLHEQHLAFFSLVNEWARQCRDQLHESAVCTNWSPLFIMGLPRSGTTLLAEMLAGHAEIDNRGEVDGLQARCADFMQSTATVGAIPSQQVVRCWGELAEAYVSQLGQCRKPPVRYVIDKTPENLLFLGFLTRLLPQAKFIWIQRDWRDVCWSSYSRCFNSDRLASTTSNLERMKQYYDYCFDLALPWWSEPTGPARRIVQFEQLVEQPETTIAQVLQFLDLPWDPQCLQFHERRGRVHTASAIQVRDPVHTRGIGSWRRYAAQVPDWFHTPLE